MIIYVTETDSLTFIFIFDVIYLIACNRIRIYLTSLIFFLNCVTVRNCNFIVHRKIIFGTVNPILRSHNIPFLVDKSFLQLLLYGDEKFKYEEKQNILEATINFIGNTARFSQM